MKRSAVTLVALWQGLAAAHAADSAAYVLLDVYRGVVLAEQDAGTLRYPASLSKLMTAYVTFAALESGKLKLTSPVTVSANALGQPASKMGFRVGTVMTVDNALKMLLVKSANDIAVAIAEAVAGREPAFIAMMNQTAERLAMVSTRYVNPHGLPNPGQVTTARDMAVLANAIWNDFPGYRSYLGIAAIKSGRKVLPSGNRLLERYTGTNGMKTGFTCSAGYNLIASATRESRTLIAVVMGEDSGIEVSERAAALLDRGFDPPFLERGLAWPQLASLAAGAAPGPAIDMRDYGVCKPGKNDIEEDEGSQSLLGQRLFVMDPVVVTTGGADPKAPAVTAAIRAAVPLPRLRPAPQDAARAQE